MSILREAEQLINGPRHADYGPFAEDYRRTVELFNTLTGRDLEVHEGVLFMVMVKLSRVGNAVQRGLPESVQRDSLVDACGYLAGYAQVLGIDGP